MKVFVYKDEGDGRQMLLIPAPKRGLPLVLLSGLSLEDVKACVGLELALMASRRRPSEGAQT